MGAVETVNLGGARRNAHKAGYTTGIGKRPVDGAVRVRAPGANPGGLGSGLVGDHIGDQRYHGGDDQAVYAFAREELDHWAAELGRELLNGTFGENLTTRDLDVDGAVIGERWRVGDAELVVTLPRIPCATFKGTMGRADWLKRFTRRARTGAYLRVAAPGVVQAGDAIELLHRPLHGITVAQAFRALTLEKARLPELLAAGDDLPSDLRDVATGRVTLELDA